MPTRSSTSRDQRLRAIIETQRVINAASVDPIDVMRVVAERAQELTGASAGIVELADGDDMVYRAATGDAASQIGLRLGIATSLSGLAVRSRSVLHSSDTELDQRVDRIACRRVGARSMVVVPLLDGDQALGVLKVMSGEPHAFDDDDIDTLEMMATFIATSLRNAQRFEAQVRHALYDPLTGLPNRTLLLERLDQALRTREPWPGALALLFIDLDGFKAVNDQLGHAAGDRLLVAFAAHAAESVRLSDTVARLGGDEFVVLCENVEAPQVDAVVRRLHQAAVASCSEGSVSASIGVAVTRRPVGAQDLLDRADAAMYERKRAHHGRAS
ncbi:sensor domain-containing diguanylate cyclase [Candidatus Binatia bacterium]|nr:sensor domain-containing diguanylate cyclase [Candidatus Binatia bacterium]